MVKRASKILKGKKILVLVILIAILLRFIGLIPNIAHTDEAYIIEHSRLLFYNIVSHFDFDPHAYKYGSFIFYLHSLVYLPIAILGFILTNLGIAQPPPSEFNNKIIDFIEYVMDTNDWFIFMVGRAITALFGIGSVYLVYLLGKKLFNSDVGLLSALILAIDPFHVRDSHYITTDVPLLFFILLSLLFMTGIIRTGRLRWYVLSGLAIGVSSTIKYFPLALLAYPIAIVMDPEKGRRWIFKILTGVLFILVGVVMGVPFIFNPESFSMFQYEVGRELLWYSTSLTSFLASIVSFITSLGNTKILPITTLIPTGFTEFHSSFLVFKVFGVPLTIVVFFGMIISLIRSFRKTLFLIIIPLATFVYISFYIPAVFERLSLPIVPFAALFAAIFFVWAKEVLIEIFGKVKAIFLFATLLILILYFPATTSFASSWSCGRESGDVVGAKWLVDNKIPLDGKIAIVAPFALPPTIDKKNIVEVRPDTDFFLSELQEKGFSYLFIDTGIFNRFTYQFENNFFTIPQELYQNYFVPLAMREYSLRASLINKFSRHRMCDVSEFFYYQIPQELPQQVNLIENFTFDSREQVEQWSIDDWAPKVSRVSILFNNVEGYPNKGSLEYHWEHIYYTAPPVVLVKIPIKGSGVYTFSGWIKSESELDENERDGFLMIDFLKEDMSDSGIALSPRIFGKPEWHRLKVTARAPKDAAFAVLSLNVIGTKDRGSVYFDDLKLRGESK